MPHWWNGRCDRDNYIMNCIRSSKQFLLLYYRPLKWQVVMHIKVAVSKINCTAQQLMHPHFMAQQFQAAPFSTGVSDKLRSNLTSNLMLHGWNQYLQSQPMCQHATLLRFEEQSCHIAKQFCCELSLTVTAKMLLHLTHIGDPKTIY